MNESSQAHGGIAKAGGAELPGLDGVTHRYIDLPGLRMHLAEAGSGEPVLLLHGFPQNWWEWRGVIPGLAAHYRVICPDLRGAGWTDAPPDGYTRDELLADIVALLDALELDRVRLVCHDWSAIIGFALCMGMPDRVERYVAIAVPHPFITFDPRLLGSAWRLWFQLAIAMPGVGPRLLSRGRQRIARYLFANYTADPGVWSEADLEVFIAQLREPARARAGSALYRRMILPELRHIMTGGYRTARLHTPTLLMYGLADPGIRAELLGGHEAHVDHMEFAFVDDASHFMVDEKPDVVAQRTLEFFAQS